MCLFPKVRWTPWGQETQLGKKWLLSVRAVCPPPQGPGSSAWRLHPRARARPRPRSLGSLPAGWRTWRPRSPALPLERARHRAGDAHVLWENGPNLGSRVETPPGFSVMERGIGVGDRGSRRRAFESTVAWGNDPAFWPSAEPLTASSRSCDIPPGVGGPVLPAGEVTGPSRPPQGPQPGPGFTRAGRQVASGPRVVALA